MKVKEMDELAASNAMKFDVEKLQGAKIRDGWTIKLIIIIHHQPSTSTLHPSSSHLIFCILSICRTNPASRCSCTDPSLLPRPVGHEEGPHFCFHDVVVVLVGVGEE